MLHQRQPRRSRWLPEPELQHQQRPEPIGVVAPARRVLVEQRVARPRGGRGRGSRATGRAARTAARPSARRGTSGRSARRSPSWGASRIGRRQQVGEGLLEHDLRPPAAQPELAVAAASPAASSTTRWSRNGAAALQRVGHARHVHLGQQVAGQIGQQVGDHRPGHRVARSGPRPGPGQDRRRVGRVGSAVPRRRPGGRGTRRSRGPARPASSKVVIQREVAGLGRLADPFEQPRGPRGAGSWPAPRPAAPGPPARRATAGRRPAGGRTARPGRGRGSGRSRRTARRRRRRSGRPSRARRVSRATCQVGRAELSANGSSNCRGQGGQRLPRLRLDDERRGARCPGAAAASSA